MATKAKTTTKKTRTSSSRAAAAKPKSTKTTTKTTVRRVKAEAPTRAPRTSAAAATSHNSVSDWFGKSVFQPRTSLGAILAEFVGTFALASIVLAPTVKGNPLLVAFGFVGITLAIAKLSGAHVNPAISIAAWVTGKIKSMRAIGYIVAQVLGGMLALLVANAFLPMQTEPNMFGQLAPAEAVFKLPELDNSIVWYTFFAQMLGTALFAFTVANLWFRKGASSVAAALTNGFGLYFGLLIAGSYGVLNPAVAAALGTINDWSIWPIAVFILAPVIGAVIGASLHKLFAYDVEQTEALAN